MKSDSLSPCRVITYRQFQTLVPDSSATAPPPTNATVANNDFNENLALILAALICAFVCAFVLKAAARLALRCVRRRSSASAAGLDRAALKQIPVAVYGAGVQIPATECSICLGELRQGEKVRILPRCSHGFHVTCIDKWLVLHSLCPVCRQQLVVPVAEFVTLEIR